MPGSDNPIAAIVPVGIDAVVGDVVVAAAVTTGKVDEVLEIDACEVLSPTRGPGELLLKLNHVDYGSLTVLRMQSDTLVSRFTYSPDPDSSITPDKLMGDRFKAFAEVADFSVAVGFCPQTESDALERTRRAMVNLEMIVTSKYPGVTLYRALPEVPDEKFDHMWATAVPTFPRASLPVSEEAVRTISDHAIRQILFTTVAAEAIATGVRAARTVDLDDIHPSLKLTSNWGYGTSGMLRALQVATQFSDKGFRGQLTENWVQWAEKAYSMPSIASRTPTTLGDDVVRRIGDFEVVMDSKGREAIRFDRDAAYTLIDELNENESKIRDSWSQTFVADLGKKFECGVSLSGRQMFKLVEIHGRYIR